MAFHSETEEKRVPFLKEGVRERRPSSENGAGAAAAGRAKSSFPFRNASKCKQQNGEQVIGPLAGSALGLLRAETAAAPNQVAAESEERGATAVQKTTEDLTRKSFQIPKKNKEKKERFQLVPVGSREFKQDILKVLNSSCLESSSSASFTYMKARLVHNERLEREYAEKRKEMRNEGRTEKELAESYAFLLTEPSKVATICEKGLSVGSSKVTVLGNPAMGIYLSKYCDVLQPNPMDNGKKAEIIIFKIIKGRVKAVLDNATKNFTPPTPKHDCHVFRNLDRVLSLFTYKAFDLTQFYLYEFGNEGIRQCPRHVCPYAVVSFIYKENKVPSIAKPVTLSSEKNCSEKSYYTIWKGQLMNKGRFLCFGSLQSATQPFQPFKLPEKLDIDMIMSVDCLKNKIPVTVFQKATFSGIREVLKNGMYYSLYELVEQSKTGRNLEPLLNKLEEDKLVFIKPLDDRGFLFLFSPSEMADNGPQTLKPKCLQALFLFPESRMSGVGSIKGNTKCIPTVHSDPEAVPQLSKIIPAIHFALDKIRKELPCSLQKATIDAAFKNNITDYLTNSLQKAAFAENGKLPQFTIPAYEEKRFPSFQQKRSNLSRILRSYIFFPHRYQFDVFKAVEMLNQYPNPNTEMLDPPVCAEEEQKFDPVPEIIAQELGNPQVKNIAVDSNVLLPSDNIADHDPDKIRELIDLIYSRKRLGPGEAAAMNIEKLAHCISDKDDLGLKRKLEFVSERSPKQMKITEGSLEEDASRLSDPVPEVTNGLGFGDSSLRQHDQTTVLAPDTQKLVGLLLEVFKSPTCPNPGTDFQLNQEKRMPVCPNSDDLQQSIVNYDWDQSNVSINEATKLNQQSIDAYTQQNEPTKEEHSKKEIVSGLEQESPGLVDSGSILPNNDDNFRIKANDHPSAENSLQLGLKTEYPEEQIVGSISSPDGCSPCTNISHDQLFSKKVTSDCTIDSEINWKLIPITDMKSRIEQLFYLPPEDSCPDDPRVINRKSNINHYQSPSNSETGAGNILKECSKDFHHPVAVYGTNGRPFDLTDDSASGIENTIKLEYNKFSDKMMQILKKEKVKYGPDNERLIFSAQKASMLSKYSNIQTQHMPVQNYINQLRKRMNSIISDSCPDMSHSNFHLYPSASPELTQRKQKIIEGCSEIVQPYTDSQLKGFVCLKEDSSLCSKSGYVEPIPCQNTRDLGRGLESGASLAENIVQSQQKSALSSFTYRSVTDSNCTTTVREDSSLTLDQTLSFRDQQRSACLLQESSGIGGPSEAQPCLTNLIQRLNPEVFCSLVEIIKDVHKNTVKFYIYEVEKTNVCAEIKGYLTGLGNKECHPEEFLKRKAGSVDKLLIIIQNEDIASHIHKVPFLTSLKKLSCVSFAGVDSLDDVQNRTYNELFVSGGFVVSDETVLNPECISVAKLKIFLEFLNSLSTTESKWIWKVHCKIHKKLKEMARTNTTAFNILSLLNKYQKLNLVEVLSYHDCDSRSRTTIDLDCLIKLQAQTIQHRHVVFLTEKLTEPFSNYLECGLVMACIDDFVKNFNSLIGYHSSSMEDKQLLRLGPQDSLQSK